MPRVKVHERSQKVQAVDGDECDENDTGRATAAEETRDKVTTAVQFDLIFDGLAEGADDQEC